MSLIFAFVLVTLWCKVSRTLSRRERNPPDSRISYALALQNENGLMNVPWEKHCPHSLLPIASDRTFHKFPSPVNNFNDDVCFWPHISMTEITIPFSRGCKYNWYNSWSFADGRSLFTNQKVEKMHVRCLVIYSAYKSAQHIVRRFNSSWDI